MSDSSSSDSSEDEELSKKINDVLSCINPGFSTTSSKKEEKITACKVPSNKIITEDEKFEQRIMTKLAKSLEKTVDFEEKTIQQNIPIKEAPSFGIKLFSNSSNRIQKVAPTAESVIESQGNKGGVTSNNNNDDKNFLSQNEDGDHKPMKRKRITLRYDESDNRKLQKKYLKESIFQPQITFQKINSKPPTTPLSAIVIDPKPIEHRSRYWDIRIDKRHNINPNPNFFRRRVKVDRNIKPAIHNKFDEHCNVIIPKKKDADNRTLTQPTQTGKVAAKKNINKNAKLYPSIISSNTDVPFILPCILKKVKK